MTESLKSEHNLKGKCGNLNGGLKNRLIKEIFLNYNYPIGTYFIYCQTALS